MDWEWLLKVLTTATPRLNDMINERNVEDGIGRRLHSQKGCVSFLLRVANTAFGASLGSFKIKALSEAVHNALLQQHACIYAYTVFTTDCLLEHAS